jgi:hypothetical protein
MFWTLLVGRGMLPFEGPPLELLHAVVQKRPMPVHEVRRDLPQVLANIVDKVSTGYMRIGHEGLWSNKCIAAGQEPGTSLSERFGPQSGSARISEATVGSGIHWVRAAACSRGSSSLLRTILFTNCQLTAPSPQLIAPFAIGQRERYSVFTLPTALTGREKELETLRNVIRHMSTSYSRHVGATYRTLAISVDSGGGVADDVESVSAGSDSSAAAAGGSVTEAGSPTTGMNTKSSRSPSRDTSSVGTGNGTGTGTATTGTATTGTGTGSASAMSVSSATPPADDLRRLALVPKSRRYGARAVIVMGEPGYVDGHI